LETGAPARDLKLEISDFKGEGEDENEDEEEN
jgi:hypothetical protein